MLLCGNRQLRLPERLTKTSLICDISFCYPLALLSVNEFEVLTHSVFSQLLYLVIIKPSGLDIIASFIILSNFPAK